jgi:DNA-cytosine methyltransferase
LNVLSLFDGMSCTRIALERLGIDVNHYYASEIDKYAMKVSEENYPNIIQIGDVTDWQSWDIDWSSIDLVIGGFPCQSWSLAGRQLGDKDERGKLFWVMLDVMKKVIENNPNAYYLMENVKMKKEFEEYITFHTEQALPNVNKYLINSALVSAQNRVRYYWTNIPGVEQPEQRGMVLRDILENKEIDGLSEKAIAYMNRGSEKWSGGKSRAEHYIKHESKKSNCLTANMHKGVPYGVIAIDKPIQVGEAIDINGHDILKRVYSEDGKSPTLNTCTGGNREPKVLAGAWRGRYKADGSTEQKLEVRRGGKTNSLTTVQKDNVVVKDEVYWRKLTPIECERLQTVPDDYTNHVSNTQRYKMLGNGFTVEVICHILNNMEKKQ